MIKYAEIHKIKIENEIRYVAKIYIDREEIEDESFKLFMDSLNFLNMMGSYKEAKYFVDEYTVSIFPNKLFKNVFDFFKVWLIKIR